VPGRRPSRWGHAAWLSARTGGHGPGREAASASGGLGGRLIRGPLIARPARPARQENSMISCGDDAIKPLCCVY
jgi:hypothetical protein